MLKVPLNPVLAIPLPIRPPQHNTLHARKKKHHNTRPTANPHPLAIIRLIGTREDIRAQNRPTLPKRRKYRERARPLTVRRMRIPHPSEHHGHRYENLRREEQAEIAHRHRVAGREKDVADSGDEAGERDERPADVEAVGKVGDGDDHDPAEEIRRGG